MECLEKPVCQSRNHSARLRWSEQPQRLSLDMHYVNQSCILPTFAIEPLEGQNMAPSSDGEASSAILLVFEAARCEGSYYLSIHQYLEILDTRIILLALSRIERDLIATCRKVDCLAHQACILQEGYLCTLRSVGIATGENTAISSNTCPMTEGPAGAGRTVLIIAITQRRPLEARIGHPRLS